MAKFNQVLTVTLDMEQAREAIRRALPSADAVARELHDVVFALGKPIAPYDDLPPETRRWFVERAERMLDLFCGDAE